MVGGRYDPLGLQPGSRAGCVFGRDPGTGICFDQAFQTLSSASFRARGANLMLSGSRGPWGFGLGAGYAHRRYTQLISGDIGSIDPVTDDSFVVNAGVSRRLGRFSSMSIDAVAAWYEATALSDRFAPAYGGYYRLFIPALPRRPRIYHPMGADRHTSPWPRRGYPLRAKPVSDHFGLTGAPSR